MPLNRNEVNPLGVLRMRKLSFIPEHFVSIKAETYVDIQAINHWITYNLKGRFAIVRKQDVNQQNKISDVVEIGMEDPKELTMLSLGCPHLHNKKELW